MLPFVTVYWKCHWVPKAVQKPEVSLVYKRFESSYKAVFSAGFVFHTRSDLLFFYSLFSPGLVCTTRSSHFDFKCFSSPCQKFLILVLFVIVSTRCQCEPEAFQKRQVRSFYILYKGTYITVLSRRLNPSLLYSLSSLGLTCATDVITT